MLSEESKKIFKKFWEERKKTKKKETMIPKKVVEDNPLTLIESIPQQKGPDPFRESSNKFGKKTEVQISTKLENLEFMDMDIILSEE